jgi:hypothetical protein
MSADHRIERISIRTQAADMAAARTQQSRLGRLLRGPVARAWSRIMDRYAGAAETILIDRLELHLTDWSEDLPDREIERRLTAALEAQLGVQLSGATAPTGAQPRVLRTAAWYADQWGDFLVSGRWLPAAAEQPGPQAYFAAAVKESSPELLRAWRRAYTRNGAVALDRLWRQMPREALIAWLTAQTADTLPPAAFGLPYWVERVKDRARALRVHESLLRAVAGAIAARRAGGVELDQFREILLAQWPVAGQVLPLLSTWPEWPEHWRQAARRYEQSPALSRGSEPPESGPPATAERGDNHPAELFVSGAGIVLLHPYLAMFFRELGLLTATGKDFGDRAAREKALQLCHWLVTGSVTCGEQDTTLYKLLCSWPEGAVPQTDHELPVAWLEAGEELLRAVIRNWAKLGETSPAALREAFLQREGKIGQDTMGYHLRVEQRGTDVLLDYLPWGIGIVKLPWMPKLLRVEWT